MKCKVCGTELTDGAKFCIECGASQEAPVAKATCKSCGAELAEGAKFCVECGASQEVAEQPKISEPQPDEAQESLCPSCGKQIQGEHKFCPNCGTDLKATEESTHNSEAEANVCAQCGAPLAPDAKFCMECGASQEVPVNKAICKLCGAELAEGAKFCVECGAPQEKTPVNKAICKSCGAELVDGTKFCVECGAPKYSPQAQPVQNDSPTLQPNIQAQQASASFNFVVPSNKKEQKAAMRDAIKRNDVHAVESLLNAGYKVNKRFSMLGGMTPIGLAAIFDSADVAQLLIQRGGHVKGLTCNCGRWDHKPLALAAINNSLATAKIILDAGADVNSSTKNGRTTLKIAEMRGHIDMQNLLIQYGAKRNSIRSVLTPIIMSMSIGIYSLFIGDGDDTFLRENY